jgi:NADPH:quinone reductase-like Zn-dependent oxidoreductase
MSQPTADGDAAPATMRAVVVTRPGGLDALEIQDVPVPVRKPGWVRIRVKAFGVNDGQGRGRSWPPPPRRRPG